MDAVQPVTRPPRRANLDPVGVWWITWACVWSTAVLSGMVFLFIKRRVPSVRLRGLTLTFCGITMLHLYWTTCQLGYVLGPMFPEMGEFWIMNTWFPAGLACFQAANSQLLHVAKLQQKYANRNSLMEAVRSSERTAQPKAWNERLLQRLRHSDSMVKMMIYILIALVLQISVAIAVFCISRKFHPGWGVPGTEPPGDPMLRMLSIGRGWEWVPSIAWQVFWAWGFAPYVLYRARNIHDTHGWRLQTIVCCIAGLPAAPLWLAALYSPAFAPINAYWIPPQWIASSIVVIEICTIFIPCWMVFKQQTLHQETLAAIALWESHKARAMGDNSTFATTLIGSDDSSQRKSSIEYLVKPHASPDTSRPPAMFTMDSLQQCLRLNPDPLLRFAAFKDFSGENISFLIAVSEWHREWKMQQQLPDLPTTDERAMQRRKFFNKALRIYALSVSFMYADFPINLPSREGKALEIMFESAARTLYGRRESFDSAVTLFSSRSWDDAEKRKSKTLNGATARVSAVPCADATLDAADRAGQDLWYWGDIPEAFDLTAFDAAERSIKHLVLLDTWPKFVRAGHADVAMSHRRSKRLSVARLFHKRGERDFELV